MLLELRQLSQSLRTANVAVEPLDDRLVGYSLGKPVFRVALTADGSVHSIQRLEREVVAALVKYRVSKGGSQESIPGFNIPPLLAAKEAEDEAVTEALKQLARRLKWPPKGDSTETRRGALDAIIDRCEPGWAKKHNAISKCLTTAVDVVLSLLDGATETERLHVDALRELLRRAKLLDPDRLRSELQVLVRRSVADVSYPTEDVGDLLKVLIRRKKAKAGNDPDAIQIMLDLAEGTDTPANHEFVWRAVKRMLVGSRQIAPTNQGMVEQKSTATLDAFGESGPLNKKKLPQVQIPVLGAVILRSHAKAKPCQARYGMIEGDSFPLARNTPAPLSEALDWLVTSDLEGKTFRDVSDAVGFSRKALLLAYPDPLPKHPPGIAAILAKAGQQGSTPPEARFVAAAELVVGQLHDLIQKTPATRISVFILAKGKKPPTKLLLSRQFSAERIVQAVRDWRAAAANIPPVFVRQFGEGKKPRWIGCDDVPFPTEVARCLNRVWLRDGERAETIAVFDFGSVLTLFLDDGRLLFELAGRALRLAVTQWIDLLLAMGQAATLDRVCPFSLNEQLLLPPILGLILAKLGHRKEVYMNALPYWLGQLLAIADRIHQNYCEHERNGDIPNGPLIGNAAMAACLENPQAGLARLAERLPLYQRVAGVELGAEVAEIVRHIDADNLPNRATDEHKAQMLLGYLARPDLLRSEPPTPLEARS